MVPLKAVDRVEILSVMDNSIDVLMGNTPVAKRHQARPRCALPSRNFAPSTACRCW